MSIIESMPSADYFKEEAASNSGLKLILRSPAHFKYPENKKRDPRVQEIGTAIHTALLEPDRFASYYMVADADDRVSAFYKGLAKDVGGHRVLTRPEHRRVLGMQDAAYRNKRFAAYMKSLGRTELSVFANDDVTGVPIKCRLDWKGDGLSAFDVKKTQDARGSEFVRAISNYGYFMQVAFYRHVWKCETGEDIPDFPLIAIEEDSPHCVVCHDLDEIALEIGRIQYRKALDIYARCLDAGYWPGYEEESELTSVTTWMQNDLLSDESFGGV